MPGPFLFAIILAVIAITCAVARIPTKRSYAAAVKARADSRRSYDEELVPVPGILLAVTAVFGAVAVILTLLSSWNPVPTQDIGIVTSFRPADRAPRGGRALHGPVGPGD